MFGVASIIEHRSRIAGEPPLEARFPLFSFIPVQEVYALSIARHRSMIEPFVIMK